MQPWLWDKQPLACTASSLSIATVASANSATHLLIKRSCTHSVFGCVCECVCALLSGQPLMPVHGCPRVCAWLNFGATWVWHIKPLQRYKWKHDFWLNIPFESINPPRCTNMRWLVYNVQHTFAYMYSRGKGTAVKKRKEKKNSEIRCFSLTHKHLF